LYEDSGIYIQLASKSMLSWKIRYTHYDVYLAL